MRPSPFLTPAHQPARGRPPRRTRIAASVVIVIVIAVAAIVIVSRSHTAARQAHAHAGAVTARRTAPLAPAPPQLSATGLRLGTPPFRLTGVGTVAQDPVQIAFH